MRWVAELELGLADSLDLLVNNAGGGFVSPVAELTANGQAALIAENFTQVVDVTRRCLPLLRSVDAAGARRSSTSPRSRRTGPVRASGSTPR